MILRLRKSNISSIRKQFLIVAWFCYRYNQSLKSYGFGEEKGISLELLYLNYFYNILSHIVSDTLNFEVCIAFSFKKIAYVYNQRNYDKNQPGDKDIWPYRR